jgi:hypothetical protein
MIITISDMWKNQQKMLDNDNQIKLSSLIVILAASGASFQDFMKILPVVGATCHPDHP